MADILPMQESLEKDFKCGWESRPYQSAQNRCSHLFSSGRKKGKPWLETDKSELRGGTVKKVTNKGKLKSEIIREYELTGFRIRQMGRTDHATDKGNQGGSQLGQHL